MLLVSVIDLCDKRKSRIILDFDGALYHVTCARDKPFTVSIKLKFFRDLEQYGTDEVRAMILYFFDFNVGLFVEVLRREYGNLLVKPLEGYNVTLALDFNTQLPQGDSNEAWLPLVRKIAMLKRNCFAAVFEKYFEYQAKQDLTTGNHKRAVIHYRDDETMYVDASADRVIVIFSTVFKDPDDNIIGRVFMEVRRISFSCFYY
jgi:actin related protein 2/3 complex subunit 2